MTSAPLAGCQDACHELEKEQIFGELWKAVRTNEETEEDSTTLKNNKTALILSLIGTEFALACNRPNNEEMKLSELLWLTTLPRNLLPILLLPCNDNHQNKFAEQIPTCDTFPLHSFNTSRLCSPRLTSVWVVFPTKLFPTSTWVELSEQGGPKVPWHHVASSLYYDRNFFFVTLHTFVSAGNRERLSAGRPDTPSCCGVVLSALCNFSCDTTHLVVWPFPSSASLKIEMHSRCCQLLYLIIF